MFFQTIAKGNEMGPYNNHAAHDAAVKIVTAALESGAIKLYGPNKDTNEDAIKTDSEYLNALISSLASNLTSR